MSRSMRICVLLVSLTSLVGLASSAAEAVTWSNSGDTAFTATGGARTFSSTGLQLSCPSASVTGTVASSPFVGVTWAAVTGTETYSGCSWGGVTTSIDCAYTDTALFWAAGSPATTTGRRDITCSAIQFNSKVCHLGGTLQWIYSNPVSPATFGKLTFTPGGTVIASNGPAGTCLLGNGDPVTFSEYTETVNSAAGGPTPHLGPIFTRMP
ncbi:MAG: hypothetical protein JWQ18_1664 [Conexibacter sp.]|nr:hypothetical protein [Conexibacter sp.]